MATAATAATAATTATAATAAGVYNVASSSIPDMRVCDALEINDTACIDTARHCLYKKSSGGSTPAPPAANKYPAEVALGQGMKAVLSTYMKWVMAPDQADPNAIFVGENIAHMEEAYVDYSGSMPMLKKYNAPTYYAKL
jgi:hypothetical protein